jgi:hypothetical protein
MTRLQAFVAVALIVSVPAASACELVLTGHRDGSERLRVAMPVATPYFEIRFVHSVLGTVVIDRYEVRDTGRVHLVEEQFAGEGYGLPAAAAPGETLTQHGEVKLLRLDRPVHPLNNTATIDRSSRGRSSRGRSAHRAVRSGIEFPAIGRRVGGLRHGDRGRALRMALLHRGLRAAQ